MLNKNEFAARIAQRTGSNHKEAKAFLDAFCSELGDSLAAGETVQALPAPEPLPCGKLLPIPGLTL